MAVTVALFAAGVVMGLAGVCVWVWGVKSGQLRNLEKTKEQLFWPEIAETSADGGGAALEGNQRVPLDS